MKKAFLTFLLAITGVMISKAQYDALDSLPPIVDGYRNANILEKASPFKYPEINNANVKFYKRIWREIDVNLPENHVVNIPDNELIRMIREAIKAKRIPAFDPADDTFKKKLSVEEVEKALVGEEVSVPKYNNRGEIISYTKTAAEFNPLKVVRYRIKEDVFYDKQRGKVETRIIGVAPLMKQAIGGGADSLIRPAFWLYFPHLRTVLASKDISDLHPEYENMSMDDYFVQRKFKSYIIMESNPAGQRIADYAKEASEQEKEANRIEQSIQEYKKKIWTYSEESDNLKKDKKE